MYKIVNIFYKSKYFDLLPKFIARRLFKIFKIFFVETNLNSLPKNNHPTTLNKEDQIKIIKNSKEIFYRPFSTCSHLLETLSVYSKIKKKFTLLDFGANNIDNYIYLDKYLDNWKYIYHDLSQYNDTVSALIKENKWNNIQVLNNLSLSKDSPLDFAFFGSSIHYAEGYQEILKKFVINKTKFLIFSHTPFYISDNNDKDQDKVLKQVNIHPVINYAYLINYNNFIQFMKDNNYKLISQNKNDLIKFLNFKNFNKNFSFIGFLDLTFTYIDYEN